MVIHKTTMACSSASVISRLLLPL